MQNILYHSVIAGIERLLQKPLWIGENCRVFIVMVTCGRIFSMSVDSILADAGNLNLLNVDCFNPYEETEYSVGAIYKTFLAFQSK